MTPFIDKFAESYGLLAWSLVKCLVNLALPRRSVSTSLSVVQPRVQMALLPFSSLKEHIVKNSCCSKPFQQNSHSIAFLQHFKDPGKPRKTCTPGSKAFQSEEMKQQEPGRIHTWPSHTFPHKLSNKEKNITCHSRCLGLNKMQFYLKRCCQTQSFGLQNYAPQNAKLVLSKHNLSSQNIVRTFKVQ